MSIAMKNLFLLLIVSSCLIWRIVGCNGVTNFDMNSCRLQLSCGPNEGENTFVPPAPSQLGRAGKQGVKGDKGVAGNKGDRGIKGEKGEPEAKADSFEPTEMNERVDRLEQRVDDLMNIHCPQTKYLFPREAQVEDFIRIKTPVHDMINVTICSWFELPKGTGHSLLSYSSGSLHNALMLDLEPGIWLYQNNILGKLLEGLNNERSYICVVITSTVKVYINASLRQTYARLHSSPILGGGYMLIGQDQDSAMGGFDDTQALSGVVENFMIWNRGLEEREIIAMQRNKCFCAPGYAISLEESAVQLYGQVVALPTDQC